MFYNEVGNKVNVVRYIYFGLQLIICFYHNFFIFVLCKEQCTWLLILILSTVKPFGYPIIPYETPSKKNTIHCNRNTNYKEWTLKDMKGF